LLNVNVGAGLVYIG